MTLTIMPQMRQGQDEMVGDCMRNEFVDNRSHFIPKWSNNRDYILGRLLIRKEVYCNIHYYIVFHSTAKLEVLSV